MNKQSTLTNCRTPPTQSLKPPSTTRVRQWNPLQAAPTPSRRSPPPENDEFIEDLLAAADAGPTAADIPTTAGNVPRQRSRVASLIPFFTGT